MNSYERNEIFGRRTRFALLTDALLYGTILWTALYYVMRDSRYPALVASLFTGAAFTMALFFAVRYALRSRRRLRARIRAELALEQLLLEPEHMARARFAPDDVLLKTAVRRDDLMESMRDGARVLWLCGEPEEDAKRFLLENGGRLTVHPKDRTAARLSDTVPEAAVEAELMRRSGRKKKLPPLRELVRQWKPNRFTLLGVLLMGLSFLTPYKLFFRIVASGCFVIGSFLYTRAIAAGASQRR